MIQNPTQQIPRMFTVYTDMCADLCHYGHFAFIDQMVNSAKTVANGRTICILIGIHSDNTIQSYKRRPIMTMTERCRMIAYHPLVSHVLEDAPLSLTLTFVQQHAIDLVCIGPRSAMEMSSMYGHLPPTLLHCIPYTMGISTTDLIRRVQSHGVIKHALVDRECEATKHTLDGRECGFDVC